MFSLVPCRQCEFDSYIDQFKMMASLDWSSFANHLTREALVLALDLSPMLDKLNEIKAEA